MRTILKAFFATSLLAVTLIPVAKAQKGTNVVEVDENAEIIRTAGEITDECVFPEREKLPDDFVVYAVGQYSGRELDFQIDRSGDMAGQIDVTVNSPSKPAALILSAYEPSIWNIKWTEDTEIIAVVARGNNRQEVAGLPKETPVFISTFDNGAKCGYFSKTDGRPEVTNKLSKLLFGQEAEEVYAFSGEIGEPYEDTDPELISSDDTTVNSFFDPTATLVGEAALELAVEKGTLRLATEADIKAWIELQKQLHPEKSVDRPAIGSQFPNSYVVTDDFTYPDEISGGIATFLIPKDVPEPNGDPFDSTIYNFKTGECSGLFCNY